MLTFSCSSTSTSISSSSFSSSSSKSSSRALLLGSKAPIFSRFHLFVRNWWVRIYPIANTNQFFFEKKWKVLTRRSGYVRTGTNAIYDCITRNKSDRFRYRQLGITINRIAITWKVKDNSFPLLPPLTSWQQLNKSFSIKKQIHLTLCPEEFRTTDIIQTI